MSVNIDLNNKYRVLLTELLPYELPLMLSNEGFYRNMLDEEVRRVFESIFHEKVTIPYDYCVKKYGGDKSRILSLIHPYSQLECVNFYEKYNYFMLSFCQNSPFSIRHISSLAKCIFKAEEVDLSDDENIENRIEIEDGEIETMYRSYFKYKRYDMMYKFFNSGDYLRLEQKFSNLLKMDIANCFYHIYTHTIVWAVKGKAQAKQSKRDGSFEDSFDTLMRHVNYDETNGIIVGPEISRIFAEIILQRIDIKVLNRLKQEPYGLKLGRDYEIRRYVDDHYIYANGKEILQAILSVYKEELQFYKLFINESKLEFVERPFVSNVSDAKFEVCKLLNEVSSMWLSKNEQDDYVRMPKNEMKIFSSIINDFRTITHKFNQKYGALNRYFLTILSTQIKRELNNKSSSNASRELLLMYVEVAFYVFSLDMNVSASIKLCRILDYLHKWSEKCNDSTILPELENRIYRETKRCMDIFDVSKKKGNAQIEALNLLLTLSRIMKTPIQRVQLLSFFSLSENTKKDYEELNYFQICSLLYIINDKVEYNDVRLLIFNEILRRLQEEGAMSKADNAMLFFDFLVCPYFDNKKKLEVIRSVCSFENAVAGQKLKLLNKNKVWFFNWDISQELSSILSKKEYHQPYE